jgi:hypothetical protein
VVAFQKNLAATADAHQLVAKFVEARAGIPGAGEQKDSQREQGAVQSAAGNKIWSQCHFVIADSRVQIKPICLPIKFAI